MTSHPFEAFKYDTQVCDVCGKLAEDHEAATPAYAEFREAMWAVLLKRGGIWSTYGTNPGGRAEKQTRKHLANCSIKWATEDKLHKGYSANGTTVPSMEGHFVFQGTFTSDSYEQKVTGWLTCHCGEIAAQEWVIGSISLGQLIWEAVKAGELPEDGEE